MTRFVMVFIVLLAVFGCTNHNPSDAPVAAISPTDSLLTCSEPGFSLSFVVPKEMLANQSALIQYNDTRGFLEISIGENFNVQLIDDSLSLVDHKAELLDDQMFTYKFYEEGERSFTYQQVLPNGQEFYYQFAMTALFDGQHYFIQSNPDMEFTLKNVKDMKKAMLTLQPV